MLVRFPGVVLVVSALLLASLNIGWPGQLPAIMPTVAEPIAQSDDHPDADGALSSFEPKVPANGAEPPDPENPGEDTVFAEARQETATEPVASSAASDLTVNDEPLRSLPVKSVGPTRLPTAASSTVHTTQPETAATENRVSQPKPDLAPFDHQPPAGPIAHYNARMTHPAMSVHNYSLLQFRHMMKCGGTPHPSELVGTWRGVNKGIATVAIDRQFIKQFYMVNGRICGDNIVVRQVPDNQLLQCGWRPVIDGRTGQVKRQGRFAVRPPQGIGHFRHGLVLDYRAGGNPRGDRSRLIWDQVVKLDDNHMLGRATIRTGLAKVPVAYFVLERIQE